MSDDTGYAVLAEKQGYDRALYLHDLTFERLIEEVVTPYEDGDPFFIDGVPVEKKDLNKIKLIKQAPGFSLAFDRLHNLLSRPRDSGHFVPIEDYPGRLGAVFRHEGVDITTSLISAYRQKKKLNLPKQELINGVFSVVVAAIRLGSS